MRQGTRDRDETGANQSTEAGIALGAEAAEHERQFREILETALPLYWLLTRMAGCYSTTRDYGRF